MTYSHYHPDADDIETQLAPSEWRDLRAEAARDGIRLEAVGCDVDHTLPATSQDAWHARMLAEEMRCPRQ